MSFPERRKRKKGKYWGPFTSSQDELDADEKFFKSAGCFSKAGGSRKKEYIKQCAPVCFCLNMRMHSHAHLLPQGTQPAPNLAKDTHLVTKVLAVGACCIHTDSAFGRRLWVARDALSQSWPEVAKVCTLCEKSTNSCVKKKTLVKVRIQLLWSTKIKKVQLLKCKLKSKNVFVYSINETMQLLLQWWKK